MAEPGISVTVDLFEAKRELLVSSCKLRNRGIQKGANWATELSCALAPADEKVLSDVYLSQMSDFQEEHEEYARAMMYFGMKEFERAAFFLENCKTKKAYFLHVYSKYLAGEKKNHDDLIENAAGDSSSLEHLKDLRAELYQKHKANALDEYGLYIYGVVLHKLSLQQEAITVLLASVMIEPMLWSAWVELASVIMDKQTLEGLILPDHWVKYFFLAHSYQELQLHQDALELYNALAQAGFSQSTYVMAQTAIVLNNIREIDQALVIYDKLQTIDPFRLDNMDTYSDLLYVKEMRKELAYLAHKCCDIDKYRVETCCIIGNYYSIRGQHEKAVLYFNRAIRLNPNYLAAWTLMGHEYMELKNTSAAIHSYRQALEANPRDFRAWYGLGQTYELLKMPLYCLYYYRKAQMLRPNDSRMVVALGVAYEKLNRLQEAKKCFWKAHSIGDIEGQALYNLARLYEKLSEEENAAEAYTEYICGAERMGFSNTEELSAAYKYLANFHIKHRSLDEAYHAAQKCMEYAQTKEEGKALLKQISTLRAGGTIDELQPPTSQRPFNYDLLELTPQARIAPMNLRFTP